jgi:hypothetical protein
MFGGIAMRQLVGSVGHYLTHKGRVRPFAAAVVAALLVLPTVEALAFFASTGTGTATGAVAGAAPTVTIFTSGPWSYAGPSTNNLMPGGNASILVDGKCATGACPAFVSTVSLGGWTSDKTGCDSTTLPGSFTMPKLVYNANVVAAGSLIGTATITWVNLTTDQGACSGATFTFTLTTP